MKKFLILGIITLIPLVLFFPAVYGDLVHTLGGTKGTGNGELDQPWGLAVNSTGHVFVAEYWNDRISVFNEDGDFEQLIINNGEGSGNGQLNGPMDVEIDSSGNIWVLEVDNQRVQKFDKEGNFLLKFGTSGSGNGQFYSPKDLVIDSSNNIWVADTNNNRIQKFDSSGNYVSQFGSEGCQVIQNDGTISGATHNGKFCNPQSIAIDDDDNLYVSDHNNRRVQKFNSSLSYQGKVGSYSTSSGFRYPYGMHVDSNDKVYATDFI